MSVFSVVQLTDPVIRVSMIFNDYKGLAHFDKKLPVNTQYRFNECIGT